MRMRRCCCGHEWGGPFRFGIEPAWPGVAVGTGVAESRAQRNGEIRGWVVICLGSHYRRGRFAPDAFPSTSQKRKPLPLWAKFHYAPALKWV
jgi:hypothetical protein